MLLSILLNHAPVSNEGGFFFHRSCNFSRMTFQHTSKIDVSRPTDIFHQRFFPH